MRFGAEGRGSHVGHPNLDRAKTLLTQAFAMFPDLHAWRVADQLIGITFMPHLNVGKITRGAMICEAHTSLGCFVGGRATLMCDKAGTTQQAFNMNKYSCGKDARQSALF